MSNPETLRKNLLRLHAADFALTAENDAQGAPEREHAVGVSGILLRAADLDEDERRHLCDQLFSRVREKRDADTGVTDALFLIEQTNRNLKNAR